MNRPDKRIAIPALLAALLGLNGCIETGTSGDFLTDEEILFKVTGTLSSSANLVVDSDVNDMLATYTSNDTLGEAQSLVNLVTVQGFASATPTNAEFSQIAAAERFSDVADPIDYYAVSLLKDQNILLTVSNAEDSDETFTGNLDLYLLDGEGDLLLSSDTSDAVERVTVPADGDYYIRVEASSGVSKYVMQILPATSASAVPSGQLANFVAGEMLVGYDENYQPANDNSTIQTFGLSSDSYRTDRPNRIVIRSAASDNLPTDEGDHHQKIQTLKAIKAMNAEAGIRYAEPNYIRQAYAQPNDPLFMRQWHYSQIDLSQAWDITTGSRSDSVPVIVAVIDTGVFLAHEDLSGKLTSDGYDFISNVNNAADGDGIDSNADDPGDGFRLAASSWHGTHVAGTVAAETNNGTGVAGVSWDARIMPLRVLGKQGATSYDLAQSILYAAGLSNDSNTVPDQKADVINMSLGSFSSSATEREAIEQAINAGVIVVAAAGNESTSVPSYPAAYSGVISVSATDANDNLTGYSNFGSTIDVAAPGGDSQADANSDGLPDGIYSTLVSVSGSTRNNGYEGYQGTSMAAPHVAGVIALMKAVNPNLTPAQVDSLIQQGQLTDDLRNDGATTRNDSFGYGRINAFKAVQAAIAVGDGSITIPAILSASPSVLNVGTADNLEFTLSNVGQGTPNIASVVASESWASISNVSTESNGLGRYRINIDRTNLNDGFYTALVNITGTDNAGTENEKAISLSLAVYVTVGEFTTEGALTRQYLLVFDAQTGSKVTETTVELNGTYSFEVPAGEYQIVAGSDTDVDVFICDPGETCGGYPSLSLLSPVSVGRNTSGIDFPVTVLGTSSALSVEAKDGAALKFQRQVSGQSGDQNSEDGAEGKQLGN